MNRYTLHQLTANSTQLTVRPKQAVSRQLFTVNSVDRREIA